MRHRQAPIPTNVAERVVLCRIFLSKAIIRLKSDDADEAADRPDDRSLTIPWHKPPSRRSRQILLPQNASRSEIRPQQSDRRARLVSAIARGRRWLDDVVSGRVTTVAQLCTREKCSARQVNMTISLAFLAPNLVKAAAEGRLPRGIGIERLREPTPSPSTANATPAMTDDTILPFSFPAVHTKKVIAAFDGGRLTSNGGPAPKVLPQACAPRKRHKTAMQTKRRQLDAAAGGGI
jgi:hypothetical protein